MRREEVKNTIKAGIFIASMSIIGLVIVFFIGKESALFDSKYIYRSKLTDAQNLRVGAKVKLKGIKVGHLQKIDFENINSIILDMNITSKYSHLIREDSYLSIRTQGMLGDKYVEILGGSELTPPLKNGGYIQSKTGKGLTDVFMKGGDLLSVTTNVLSKVDTLLAQLTVENNIYNTLNNISKSSNKLTNLLTHIDGKKLGNVVNNLDAISTRMSSGPGTIYSLIYDQTAYEELRTILGGAQRNKMLKYFIRESIKNSEKVESKD